MKKITAVFLCAAIVLNCFAVSLFAADAEQKAIIIPDYMPQIYINTALCENCNSNYTDELNTRIERDEIIERHKKSNPFGSSGNSSSGVMPEWANNLTLADWAMVGVLGYISTVFIFSMLDTPEFTRVK